MSQGSLVLLVGGLDCRPFSPLGLQKGFDDPRAAPVRFFLSARDELQRRCRHAQLPFRWLIEEVATMSAEFRQSFTQLVGSEPLVCQAGDFGWVHRARLYYGVDVTSAPPADERAT